MTDTDPYNTWKQARGNRPVPERFADGVMDEIRRRHCPAKKGTGYFFAAIRPRDSASGIEKVACPRFCYRTEPVRRGDVVVFRDPDNRSQAFFKRVVALPGDTVELRANELYVNGKQLPRQLVPDAAATAPAGRAAPAVYVETNARARYRIRLADPGPDGPTSPGDVPELTVPTAHCYVLGDNRNLSKDSRAFGPIPLADLIGRAEQIYFPRWQSLRPEPGSDPE
jgi:signal peptidase I